MGNRKAILLALLLLLPPAATVAHGLSGPLVPNLALGFGPQSMEPVSFGVPVYTIGDEIWVQSFNNSATLLVTLSEPSSVGGFAVQTQILFLVPGSLVNLYTLKPGDPLGNWSLSVFDNTGGPTLTVGLRVAAAASLAPTYRDANVTGSGVSLGYLLPVTSAYNVQECTIGASASSTASFQLPGDIGGSLSVSLNGGTATASDPNTAITFTGWLELYAARAFQNGVTLVSEQTLAANSEGLVSINATTSVNRIPLIPDLNMRPGRYDLRAYVRGPSGLTSYDAPYLLVNGTTWISLRGCTQLASVGSQEFSMTTDLSGSNSTWPRELFTMYTMGGVEGVTASRVPVSEVRIDVKNNATSGRLAGVEMSAQGAGVHSWSSYNSGIYLIGTGYPLTVNVTLDFGGVATESFGVNVTAPFQHVNLRVEAGTLVVRTTAGGGPLANATVGVSPAGSARQAVFTADSGGNVTLTLPLGEYDANASFSGRSGTGVAQVTSGGTAVLRFDLSGAGIPVAVYLLGAVLAAGLGGNILVWRTYLERRRG